MPNKPATKMKPCKICGKLFLPETNAQRICKDDHYIACPICRKQMLWNSTRAPEPCSEECKKEATRRKNQEKYGCDHPMQNKEVQQHHKQAMLDKYGVESPLQDSSINAKARESMKQTKSDKKEHRETDYRVPYEDLTVSEKRKRTMIEKYGAPTTLQCKELREKAKQTTMKKYGVDNVHKSESVKEKTKQTNLKKYGVENPMQDENIARKSADKRHENIDEINEKIKNTMMERYGVENAMQDPEFIDKITDTFMERYGVKRAIQVPEFKQKMIDTMQERYGVDYYYQSTEYDHVRISKINKAFAAKLDEKNIPYEYEFKIGRKCYDLHILNTNILIEIDPTYTHNAIGNHWNSTGLDMNYHLEKTQIALENGYRCIHVFDWDNWDKIIDMLLPAEKLYARNLDVWRLTRDFTNEFLKKYHLQGSCRGQILSLGLVKDNTCYMIMTFGRSRYDKRHDIELLRLCSLPGYNVIGGASKLFKYAIRTYEIDNIISYCDVSKFTGDVYDKLNMKLIRTTRPQEVWSKEDKKITANLLRQRGYDQLFHTNHGKGQSNELLMLKDEWLPIYDCGQQVWEYTSD